MLRILKDCRLCGVSVHPGEIFSASDFREADVQVIVGAGFAELFVPPEPEDIIPEEPEDFAIASVNEQSKQASESREASAEPPEERNVPTTAQVEAPPQARAARAQKKKTKK